jgi:hypothetical protein
MAKRPSKTNRPSKKDIRKARQALRVAKTRQGEKSLQAKEAQSRLSWLRTLRGGR